MISYTHDELVAILGDPAEQRCGSPGDGRRWTWKPEGTGGGVLLWTAPPPRAMRCRFGASRYHKACGQPAVATLRRGKQLWGYCEEHLYGRRLLDGRIWYVGWERIP